MTSRSECAVRGTSGSLWEHVVSNILRLLQKGFTIVGRFSEGNVFMTEKMVQAFMFAQGRTAKAGFL